MNNPENKMRFENPNPTTENVAKIAGSFPGVVVEGKVNIDLLRSCWTKTCLLTNVAHRILP